MYVLYTYIYIYIYIYIYRYIYIYILEILKNFAEETIESDSSLSRILGSSYSAGY